MSINCKVPLINHNNFGIQRINIPSGRRTVIITFPVTNLPSLNGNTEDMLNAVFSNTAHTQTTFYYKALIVANHTFLKQVLPLSNISFDINARIASISSVFRSAFPLKFFECMKHAWLYLVDADKNQFGLPLSKFPDGCLNINNSTINIPLKPGSNELLIGNG